MRDDSTTLLLAAGLGAISGIRSMSGVALLSRRQQADDRLHRRIQSHFFDDGRSLGSVLSTKAAGVLTAAMATGEMAADKGADLPPRTDLASLIGRATFGALSGAVVAEIRSGNRVSAALVGAVSAVGSAHLFYRLRKVVSETTPIPDWAVGLAEDVLVLAGGKRLVDVTTPRR